VLLNGNNYSKYISRILGRELAENSEKRNVERGKYREKNEKRKASNIVGDIT
jgi:hypothetical protein